MDQREFLTLSDYQRRIGDTIRLNRELQSVWVMAELSDVRISGGHCYLELVEKDSRGGMRAKLRAMIWSSTLMGLRSRFLAETGRDIASGMKVLVRGSANHHDVYGLSFVISDIDPSYTLGDMERLRREILARLEKEGVVDSNKRLPVPETPQRVAVISAAGAAGYGDFINQLSSNVGGYIFYPFLFPAVMQGDRTVSTVLDALDLVERTSKMWDCVVIIRGGGATAELNSFDDYSLARRVATFPLPVVVGIGHERDRTVLDELACVRCKTPTAVAAWLIERLDEAYGRAYDSCRRIGIYVSEALKGEHLRLGQAEAAIPARVATRTLRARMALQQTAARIDKVLQGKSRTERGRLDVLAQKISAAAKRCLEFNKAKLERLDSMHRVLSPDNTLKRGYSITRLNGHAVSDATMLSPGDVIQTTLLNGTVTSEVKQ